MNKIILAILFRLILTTYYIILYFKKLQSLNIVNTKVHMNYPAVMATREEGGLKFSP